MIDAATAEQIKLIEAIAGKETADEFRSICEEAATTTTLPGLEKILNKSRELLLRLEDAKKKVGKAGK